LTNAKQGGQGEKGGKTTEKAPLKRQKKERKKVQRARKEGVGTPLVGQEKKWKRRRTVPCRR